MFGICHHGRGGRQKFYLLDCRAVAGGVRSADGFGYEKLNDFAIELYANGDLESLNYESFIWIPVNYVSTSKI